MPSFAHPVSLGPPDELAARQFEIVLRRLADDLAFGADVSRFTGSGLEYAQSRPYAPGDSVRQLDWKTSARRSQPYVKEYEALKRVTTHLIVDTSASMAVSSQALSKLDLGVWLAAALGLVALRRLCPVGIHVAGTRGGSSPPSLSRARLRQSLETLRTKDFAEQTALAPRLRDLAYQADRTSLLIVLSDLHDPEAVSSLMVASERHDLLVLRLIDPAEVQPLRAGFVRGRAAEGESQGYWIPRRPASVWQDQRVRELQQAGIDVLELRTDQPFLSKLRPFLGARGRRLRG